LFSEYKAAGGSGNDSVTPKFIHRLRIGYAQQKKGYPQLPAASLTKLIFFPQLSSGCEQLVWEINRAKIFGTLR
jgi:hypothetical protein